MQTNTDQEQIKAKAAQLWVSFDADQKACVRFGMLPQAPMLQAEAAGYEGRLLACAIYACAKNNGGMIA